jgi:hypothetical protein
MDGVLPWCSGTVVTDLCLDLGELIEKIIEYL